MSIRQIKAVFNVHIVKTHHHKIGVWRGQLKNLKILRIKLHQVAPHFKGIKNQEWCKLAVFISPLYSAHNFTL